MPAEQGPVSWDAERFDRALEQGTPPGSVADPELTRDLEIAAMLSVRGEAYAPRPEEKARARQQLMARLARMDDGAAATATTDDTVAIPVVTPVETLVEDDASRVSPLGRPGRRASRHAVPSRPAGRPRGRGRAGGLGRRALLVGIAALLAVVAVAGGGILASRNALPGDPLYGVKRVAESAGLALTFDDTAKARRQLQLATTRLDEVEQLAAREPSAADPALFQSAIKDFDSSTGAGSRMLLNSDDAGGTAALGDLRAWAGEQVARLSALRATLPAPAVPGADSSISLLDRLLGRTEALGDRSSCNQVTSGVVDDIGPLPAQGACSPRPAGSPGGGSTGGGPTGGTPTGGGPTGGSPTGGSPTGGSPDGTAGGTGVTGTDPVDTAGRAATGAQQPSPAPGPGPGATDPGTGEGDGGPLSGVTGAGPKADPGSSARTTTSAPSGGGGNVPVPVPLPLPPVQVPPVLPGRPGVTIGG